jgi:enoyl-CoA hydratase/carnithine racemase
MFKTLNCHIHEEIGFIELNQPPLNRMTKLFFHEIRELADILLNKETVKGIIIYGKGRHFSSGADIDDLLSFDSKDPSYAEDFYIANSQTFQRFYTAKIPVVAAIKGVCIGSAMELAMACHFRLATENVLMGFPEAGFNLMPGCGGSVYLSELLDTKNVMDLLISGRNLNIFEALDLGIVDCAVHKKKLIEKAVTFVKEIQYNYHHSHRCYYVKNFLKDNPDE